MRLSKLCTSPPRHARQVRRRYRARRHHVRISARRLCASLCASLVASRALALLRCHAADTLSPTLARKRVGSWWALLTTTLCCVGRKEWPCWWECVRSCIGRDATSHEPADSGGDCARHKSDGRVLSKRLLFLQVLVSQS
jgi:hypothetical protein